MKIALTSQNFKTVTNHAGRARRFLVYQVENGQAPVEIERIDLPKDMCIHELGGQLVAHPLDAVDVLISASFGPGFARNMERRNVIASLTEETDPIRAIEQFVANGQRLPGGAGCGQDHGPDHGHGHSHEDGHDGCHCH